MKIGLGMGFAKRSQAVEFSAALQTFRRYGIYSPRKPYIINNNIKCLYRHVASLEEDINTPDSNLQTTKVCLCVTNILI